MNLPLKGARITAQRILDLLAAEITARMGRDPGEIRCAINVGIAAYGMSSARKRSIVSTRRRKVAERLVASRISANCGIRSSGAGGRCAL